MLVALALSVLGAAAAGAPAADETPPPAILIRLKDALSSLADGERGAHEAEAGLAGNERVDAARQALRTATAGLEAIAKELTTLIPARRRSPPPAGELTADELVRLSEQVQFQLGRAQLNRALLYERSSDDRLTLLLSAVETFERALPQTPASDPLHAEIALELARSRRMLGRFAAAEEAIALLDRPQIPDDIRLRARSERVRLAIAEKDWSAVSELLAAGGKFGDRPSADLDLAFLEGHIALAQAGHDLAKNQDKAAALARSIQANQGADWSRRADQLLATARLPGLEKNEELLIRRAESLYRSGQLDEALHAYDDAAGHARLDNDLPAAFKLAYQAALIEQKRGNRLAAAERLQILAKNMPSQAGAAQAHLLAAWNAGALAASDKTATETYRELLQEHIGLWPMSESADQARVWLGELLEAEGSWQSAVTAYRRVPAASSHYAAAVTALARCWPKEVSRIAATGQHATEAAAEAIEFFRQAAVQPEDRSHVSSMNAARAAALAASELIIHYQPAQAAIAADLLRRALAAADDARADDARAHNARANDTSAAWRKSAESLLAVASAKERLADAQAKAAAHAAAGRRAGAIAAYAELASKNADDGQIQLAYARLLLDSSEQVGLRQALAHWRLIASRSPARSAAWLEAKYSLALTHYKLGDRQEAAQLLEYLLETPPGLKGTDWESRFRELLSRCRS